MSATGSDRRRPHASGFTLVELMIVLVIVGLASAAVLFALPDPRGGVRDAGERLAVRVRAAQELAIVSGRPLALRVDARGYRFEQRARGGWAVPTEPALAAQVWPGGIAARVAGEGRVLIDPTGGGEPLAVTLERGDARTSVRITTDGGVHVD